VLALGVVLVIYGIKFCNSPLSIRGKYVAIPTLSKFWQYLPIPVAGVGMVIFELEQIFRHVEALVVKKTAEEGKGHGC
jgi:TRAP-type C4-dicarboxylate transport system permease small subunit